MPDYIYLLENRLSPAQQEALRSIREAAREEGMTIFLTGGAVRDLTSGSPVRDLDVSVQGNALNLRHRLVQAGAKFWGEHVPSQTVFFRFPGSVRVEVSSTRREEFPKPGKPVYEWASILEDLRRRDFTVNAMAVSLNDGSYGLLMDPTNGVADLESRTLRLVNNYGFLEDPIRLVRATRFMARLGWQMDERTQARFENARADGVSSAISPWQKGYELEEIGHEENPLEILRAMEAAGWMKEMCPAWTPAKADVQGLEQMHEVQTRLEMQGIRPDTSAAAMELLTAKMAPKEIEALRKCFVRPGFVAEWKGLDADAEEFQKQLSGREASTPSATWKLFMRGSPEAILWLGLTGKGSTVQNKFKNFFNVWPAARQKVPTALMQEMRITPELERYPELLEELFYQTIDGKLETEEQIRAFLEPYSPPAPAPTVTVRRTRAAKKAAKQAAAAEATVAVEENTAGQGEDIHEMVEAPGQEAEREEVARRDIPAVGNTTPPDGGVEAQRPNRGKAAKAAKQAKSPGPADIPSGASGAKKPVPERELPPQEVASPAQAAARLAGGKVSTAGVTQSRSGAKTAGKSAGAGPVKAQPPARKPQAPVKAAAKAPAKETRAAAKPPAKTAAKGTGAKAAPSKGAAPAKASAKGSAVPGGKGAPAKAPAKSAKRSALAKKSASKPAKKAAGKRR